MPSGPLVKSATASGSKVVVTFEYGGVLRSSDGTEVIGFELAGKDMLYHKATCRLEGDRAVLSTPEVKNPVYVRYAWEPYTRANLVNSAGLPASTFLAKVTSL